MGSGLWVERWPATDPLEAVRSGRDVQGRATWDRLRSTADMVKLSVNVNKVATVRNSRGGRVPSVLDAVRVCVAAGSPGITVHPRADERHITTNDVHEVAAELAPLRGQVEFNIEGDPRSGFVDMVARVRPD